MATISGAILQAAGFRPGASGIQFQVDNAADIGATAASRPRDLHLGRNALIGGTLGVTGATTVTGSVYVGDTSDANVTLGQTTNQLASDNFIQTWKSSDVAHGATTDIETDSFGGISKASATTGGVALFGFTEATAATRLVGFSTSDNTVKTTSGRAVIEAVALLKTGTTGGDAGADANLFAIINNGTTRFLFDAEGSAHADVSWTTFDSHNDLALIEDMETLLAPGQVQRQFGKVVKHDREFFERQGLLHDVRRVGRGRMRGMLNTTRALMLSLGAIRQVGGRVAITEAVLRHLLAGDVTKARRLLPA